MTTISLNNKLGPLPKNFKKEVADLLKFLVEKNENAKEKKVPKFGSCEGFFKISLDFNDSL